MTDYIIRRILFMIPTMFGIMLVAFVVVQFAPGGPVDQVIAEPKSITGQYLSGRRVAQVPRASGQHFQQPLA